MLLIYGAILSHIIAFFIKYLQSIYFKPMIPEMADEEFAFSNEVILRGKNRTVYILTW
jgi:hypothetical protein